MLTAIVLAGIVLVAWLSGPGWLPTLLLKPLAEFAYRHLDDWASEPLFSELHSRGLVWSSDKGWEEERR